MSKTPAANAQKKIVLPLNQFQEAMLKAATMSKESLVQALWEPRDSLVHTLFGLILKDNNTRKASSKAGKEMLAKLAKLVKVDTPEGIHDSADSSDLAKSKSKLSTLMAYPEMAYGLLLPIAHVRTHLLMVGCYADQNNSEFPYWDVKVNDNNPPNLWLIPVEFAQRGILSESYVKFIFDSAPQAFREGPLPAAPMLKAINKVNLHAVPNGKYMFTLNMLRSWEIKAPAFSKAMSGVGFNEVFREHIFYYVTQPTATAGPDEGDPTSKVKVVFMPSFTELLGLSVNLTKEQVKLPNNTDWSMSFFDPTVSLFFNQLSASLEALGKMYLPSVDEFRFFQENKTRLVQKLHTQDPHSAAKRLHDLWENKLKSMGTSLKRIMPLPTATQMEKLSLSWPFCLSVGAVSSLHTGLLYVEPDEDAEVQPKPYPEFLLEPNNYAVEMLKTWTLLKSRERSEEVQDLIEGEPFVLDLSFEDKEEALKLAKDIEQVEGIPRPTVSLYTAKAQELASFCGSNAIAMHRLLSASLMDLSPPNSMPDRELGDVFWMY